MPFALSKQFIFLGSDSEKEGIILGKIIFMLAEFWTGRPLLSNYEFFCCRFPPSTSVLANIYLHWNNPNIRVGRLCPECPLLKIPIQIPASIYNISSVKNVQTKPQLINPLLQ